jgi:Photoprotection regulator fluorescence recovery protein
MSGPSATPQTYPYRNEPIWSRLERVIARKIFDAALKRELHQVMQETKQKASQLKEARDLWTLERYLTDRRKDIDRKYDFRASRLTRVFGALLCEGRVTEEELHGLQEDKLALRSI